jgi:5-formyltetrahydrofolate cyclo-ligase
VERCASLAQVRGSLKLQGVHPPGSPGSVEVGTRPGWGHFEVERSQKLELRQHFLALRREVSPAQRAAAGDAVAAAGLSLLEASSVAAQPGAVGLYAALRQELPTEPLFRALHQQGVPCAYPRQLEGPAGLRFFQVESPQQLQRAGHGFAEPPEHLPVAPSLLFVPGLGFDRRGHRLGYGGGLYDRYLASLPPSVLRVGLTYDECVVDRLPAEPHDVPMHWVLTPTQQHPGCTPLT